MNEQLKWKKYNVLNDGFICLVDAMGDDSSIVQAARVSYGKDKRETKPKPDCPDCRGSGMKSAGFPAGFLLDCPCRYEEDKTKDRQLIRYLLNHSHTTPFEMVEFKFLVRVPMDCWRQWIRHRTASVNEYSTRYTEAIDSQQTTSPQEWRLQATDNKQGSSGFLEEWPEGWTINKHDGYWRCVPPNQVAGYSYGGEAKPTPGDLLTTYEFLEHTRSTETYKLRLDLGIAKEQARKDLPLSTYTEAYWKCDLHNIFNFLRLRMDSHAQYEIRMYANAMAEIVKQIVPVAWEAFEDYVLHAKKFSRMEMEYLRNEFSIVNESRRVCDDPHTKPDSMTTREWKEFLEKLA